MLEAYRDSDAPPQARAPALKPKLRSWTGRVWRWARRTSFQLMLKLDASLAISEIEDAELRAALSPFAGELASFPLYLDHSEENQLPLSWAVGALQYRERQASLHALLRFPGDAARACAGDVAAAAGAQSDLILSVIPYSVETNRLIFAIADYDLGFHNRIG